MNMRNLFLTLAFGLCSGVFAQNTTVFESPIMGWSSWNTYLQHIHIIIMTFSRIGRQIKIFIDDIFY